MSNHLIIGLGGTGGKIIRSFRKTIYQEFRSDKPEGVHIGYLYMDSSSEMMDLNDPSWKVLGHSVQLGQNSQLRITGTDLEAVLDNVQSFPGIRPWIGDRKQWKDILNSVVGEMLGGQKRRLGRFLFANKITQFVQQVQTLVNALKQDSGSADVTFHICCGLAGGTGSGTVIDVVSQLRKLGFQGSGYRVVVYAMLPDAYPPHNWDTGNYHANGYAALTELNALSVGSLKPCDLTGETERINVKDPFNGCYLFTNENVNRMTVNIDTEMPNIVSDFLYQKIVTVKDMANWVTLKKMENAENGDGTPEKEAATDAPLRSKRFLTFGIKRLAVPEEEMLEYLTYNFTRQAALQLLYNNWQDGLGFQDEPGHVDFKGFVQEKDIQLKWRIKNEHICLSEGILDIDIKNKKWKPITAEWNDFITNSTIMLRESGNKKAWLDELENLCQKRFAEDYRNMGVKRFYETKLKARTDMAKEICRIIEADLFDDWKNGVKSIHEINRLLSDLISVTEERIEGVEDSRAKHDARQDNTLKLIKSNRKEWASLGLVSTAFGKRDKLLDAHAVHLKEYYIHRTLSEAWNFGKKLLEELKVRLTDLKNETETCIGNLQQADNIFQRNIAARCNDDESMDLTQHLIRFYRPDMVKTVADRFIRDEEVQKSQTNHIRSFLVGRLGENTGFKSFNKNISITNLMDFLANECEESAKNTHDRLIQTSSEKLLGVSIIERLKNQYAADHHGLRIFVKDLVGFAGNYLTFSQREQNMRGGGISDPQSTCLSAFTVILPKAPEHAEFLEILKSVIQENREDQITFLESETRQNEITLISITNLFPIRFIEPVANLREKYKRRIEGSNAQRALLELHIEEDGSQHPGLYLPSTIDTIGGGIPYILLAKAVDLLVERENKDTGAKTLSIITKDEDGFDNDPIDLGKSLPEIQDNLDEAKVNMIKEEVGKILKQKEYLHVDRQKEVIQTMNAEIDAIKAERGIDDDIYKQYLKGAKKAAAMIKTEKSS